MLSRVANSLYWVSRYLERAENLARMVEVNRYDSLDNGVTDTTEKNDWEPLLYATCLQAIHAEATSGSKETDVGRFITFSEKNNDSIRQCVAHARENARMVRDQISEEFWRELNRFHLFVASADAISLWTEQPESFYRKIIEHCMLLTGLLNTTISHDEGWHFMQLGKSLERADKTTRVLDMLAYQREPHRTRLASALRSCSALSAFKSDSRNSITLENIMSFLLFSASFPRSVRFCIRQLDKHLHAISESSSGSFTNEAERLAGSLLAQVNFSSIDNVLQEGYHTYIDTLQNRFNQIGQQIFETYILLPSEIRSIKQDNSSIQWQFQQQQQ